jgi:hypothetical protein
MMTSYIKETGMLVSNLPALQYHVSAQTLPYKDNDLIDRKFEVGTFWLRSYVQGWHTKDFGRILQIVFREI